MSEVKIFRVTGLALFGHDKYPEWRKFVVDVRALKPEHAVEHVYSVLGGRHKLKRGNIKIIDVKEISPEETKDHFIRDLSKIEGFEIGSRKS
ncbi:MAG: 50S ribosomal protein L18a [Desulfurococcales archaeon]|jgi:large subunit ribosomal protein LX|nr:50S ribosomal protein L18a [Desulfurococcales archaeon]MCC6061455.1 50S ribosomal protein L18a [Desulfurococcales archaeon]MCI4456754.1 50S ribosomal protein L18a [Desulfurococcaceae archaeon]NAZ13974.1 50S ribosomal protein L18a [Desulfurococcales archaeon]